MAGALEGLRVLDLTQNLAGPFCTMHLADHGADVIKIEPPHGEEVRRVPPFVEGESAAFMMWNRNKRSLVLDLKDNDDCGVLQQLIATADILVESFRPGVMAKLGFGYTDLAGLYPRLIYGSISGYGQTGPMAALGGFDVMAQGLSGLMAINGPKDGPPHRLPIPICDLTAGLHMGIGLLAAVEARRRTGRGQHVETSLLEAALSLQVYEAVHVFTKNESPPRMGQAHRGVAPYQVFPTRDGHVTIGAGQQKFFETLCRLAELPGVAADPRFANGADRVANNDALVEMLSEATRRHPTSFWIEELGQAGVPCGPVLDQRQILTHDQTLSRRMVEEIQHPKAGCVRTLGVAVKMSETPGAVRRPAPSLSEHSAEIRADVRRRAVARNGESL